MEVYAILNFGHFGHGLPQTETHRRLLKACCAAQLAPSLDEWHGEGEELALLAPRGSTTGSGLQGVSQLDQLSQSCWRWLEIGLEIGLERASLFIFHYLSVSFTYRVTIESS